MLTLSILTLLLIPQFLLSDDLKTHPSIKLRHGYSYTFKNTMSVKYEIWISDFIGSTFSEKHGDYNGGKNPKFEMPKQLITFAKKQKYHVGKNKSVVVFESTHKYPINYHPKNRKKDNLVIKYVTNYYSWKNNDWGAKKTNIAIQPYEITWCGDGIIDNYIDSYGAGEIIEVCDWKDKDKKYWGNAGCSSKCTPLSSH